MSVVNTFFDVIISQEGRFMIVSQVSHGPRFATYKTLSLTDSRIEEPTQWLFYRGMWFAQCMICRTISNFHFCFHHCNCCNCNSMVRTTCEVWVCKRIYHENFQIEHEHEHQIADGIASAKVNKTATKIGIGLNGKCVTDEFPFSGSFKNPPQNCRRSTICGFRLYLDFAVNLLVKFMESHRVTTTTKPRSKKCCGRKTSNRLNTQHQQSFVNY